jgi:hypothetical protein
VRELITPPPDSTAPAPAEFSELPENREGADHPDSHTARKQEASSRCAPRFSDLLELFGEFDGTEGRTKLFPKACRVCGRNFHTLSEYVSETKPKSHVFEDCSEIMKMPFTMVYRHCTCGNTLVMTFTQENFPALDFFWSVLREEALRSERTLTSVVSEFSELCDRYFIFGKNPCRVEKSPKDHGEPSPIND